MVPIIPPDRDSIFGDTYAGVPNPTIPHVHPWPTRYHGPNFTVPGTADLPYVQNPYASTPFAGPPVFEYVTGSSFFDTVIGAAAGYVGSGSAPQKDKVAWAAIGGLAAYAAGFAGIAGVVAAIVVKKAAS